VVFPEPRKPVRIVTGVRFIPPIERENSYGAKRDTMKTAIPEAERETLFCRVAPPKRKIVVAL
jgi:hypothetical protein